jgi:hypothetical protein
MKDIYIKISSIQGTGLFAGRAFKPREVVGIVEGPIVPDTGGKYQHPVSFTEVIENENITRFTNHSCDPSCVMDDLKIIAWRPLKAGDEITIDYDTIEWDWEMPCHCGSPKCRVRVRGYKYLCDSLRAKYGSFVAPYLRTIQLD